MQRHAFTALPRAGSLRALVLVLAILTIAGFTSLASATADSGTALPAYDVTITPNWLSTMDPASSNYQSVWIYPTSPTTPWRSPDSQHQVTRYLLLDPRYTDSEGRPGKDDWWFIIHRNWSSSFDPNAHGAWGRQANFHNVAGDAGPANSGGVGWGFGNGVSAFALDWQPQTSAPQFGLEPENRVYPMPVPKRDAWHTYVVHFVAGRTDGSTIHPGALTIWADGDNTPVVQASNINTVQRAKGPDGNYYTQRWMTLWEGDYTRGLPTTSTVRLTLTRIGNTFAQAVADRPVISSTNASSQYYSGSGANYGAPSVKDAPALQSADSGLPSSLLGTGTPPPPATTPVTTTTPTTTTTAPPTTTTTPAPTTTTTPAPTAPAPASASVTDASCTGCRVSESDGELTATIGGGHDSVDTAYVVKDLGTNTDRVFVGDELRFARGQVLTANVALLQMRTSSNALVYELYAAADRTLRLWSPAGGLRSSEINLSTGIAVPNDGNSIRVEVSARPNDWVTVRVNGSDRINLTGLSGSTSRDQRFVIAGIDHYDSPRLSESVTVVHRDVAGAAVGSDRPSTTTPTTTPTTPTTTTAPTPAPPAPGNLVANGGFESDPSIGWYSIADGGVYSWSTDAHSGSRSAKIVSKVASMTRWMTKGGSIPATAGKRYSGSAWVKTTGRVTFALVFWDGQGRALGTAETTPTSAGSWTNVSVQSAAPAGTTSMRVELRLRDQGTLFADDVAVTAS